MQGQGFEIKYIGHAGTLVRRGDVVVAVDPFLSGRFWWNGHLNVYKGDSPWIGGDGQLDRFVDEHAGKLAAIAISHAHMDHFDPEAIIKLLRKNREIEIIAPRTVIRWIKASSILNPVTTKYVRPVEWDGTLLLEGETCSVEIHAVPNSGIDLQDYPPRVGYFFHGGEQGLFLPGDSQDVGPWSKFKHKTTHLVTWSPSSGRTRTAILTYFPNLQRVFWIHHEQFEPGNFTCNQDISCLLSETGKLGVPAGSLAHDKFIPLD